MKNENLPEDVQSVLYDSKYIYFFSKLDKLKGIKTLFGETVSLDLNRRKLFFYVSRCQQ